MGLKKMIGHGEKNKCNDSGFTIIEVLIALAIFAIGILGVAKMQLSSTHGYGTSRKYLEAGAIVQSRIESLMVTPFDTITNGSATTTEGYTVVWTVVSAVDLNGDGNNEIKNINMVVNDPSGKKRADISFAKAADI